MDSDFFLRDFLGISGRLVGESPSWLWLGSLDLPTLSDFFDCLVFSGFSFMGVSAAEPADAWRLVAFRTSGNSRAGEQFALLLELFALLLDSTQMNEYSNQNTVLMLGVYGRTIS